ncbi:MAG: trypsin-like peptidase domain-containing protein [Bryobacteraceae bacterium]|jgi:serine protease Do
MKSPALLVFLGVTAGSLLGQTPGAPAALGKRLDALHGLSEQLEALSNRVGKAVVQIYASGYRLSAPDETRTEAAAITRERDTGSGAILTADGYIVTNSHVVSSARRVQVRVPGDAGAAAARGKMLEAHVVGVDRDSDLALIKVEASGLPFLEFGDSDQLRQGQLVMAFGSPLGLENSVSMGVVSSVARQIKPDDVMAYVQTDAPINPGNSGGPLVNADGLLVGINTFILSQSGGSEGLGFAIPSNLVRSTYEQLRKEGHVHRGEIGVVAQTVTPDLAAGLGLTRDWGVVLSDVTPDGPASQAGLEVGDLVLAVDGRSMQNARQLEMGLFRRRLGQKVNLEVERGDEKLTYPVTVAERDDDPQRFADMVDPIRNMVRRLGILGIDIDANVSDMFPELRKKYGVVVAARTGEAAYIGDSLEPGDVIYALNKEPVTSVEALKQVLNSLKPADPVVLQVQRDNKLRYVTLSLGIMPEPEPRL